MFGSNTVSSNFYAVRELKGSKLVFFPHWAVPTFAYKLHAQRKAISNVSWGAQWLRRGWGLAHGWWWHHPKLTQTFREPTLEVSQPSEPFCSDPSNDIHEEWRSSLWLRCRPLCLGRANDAYDPSTTKYRRKKWWTAWSWDPDAHILACLGKWSGRLGSTVPPADSCISLGVLDVFIERDTVYLLYSILFRTHLHPVLFAKWQSQDDKGTAFRILSSGAAWMFPWVWEHRKVELD